MWPVDLPPAHVVPAAPDFASNVPAGTWPSSSLPVAFVLALPRSRDVGANAAAELDAALRAWPRVACTGWRTRFDGEMAAVAADDGINVVLFHDDAWPSELIPGAIAQTVIHTTADGHYRDADIHLNGVDYRFSLDGAPGTQDLRSVLTHELGHALGLGHSSDPRATMYATGSGLRWRSLEQDDRNGVCALYPGNGSAGCDAVPCPAPFVCVASACQRPHDVSDVCSPFARVDGACEAAGDDARCIDIGNGATAGQVCGRSCTTDASCGAAFHCLATTASGDRQCVSDTACRNGANICQMDADCTNSVCRDGACVGVSATSRDAGDADAGGDARPSADADAVRPEPLDAGGGCSCDVAGGDGSAAVRAPWLAWLVLAAAVALRRARQR